MAKSSISYKTLYNTISSLSRRVNSSFKIVQGRNQVLLKQKSLPKDIRSLLTWSQRPTLKYPQVGHTIDRDTLVGVFVPVAMVDTKNKFPTCLEHVIICEKKLWTPCHLALSPVKKQDRDDYLLNKTGPERFNDLTKIPLLVGERQ